MVSTFVPSNLKFLQNDYNFLMDIDGILYISVNHYLSHDKDTLSYYKNITEPTASSVPVIEINSNNVVEVKRRDHNLFKLKKALVSKFSNSYLRQLLINNHPHPIEHVDDNTKKILTELRNELINEKPIRYDMNDINFIALDEPRIQLCLEIIKIVNKILKTYTVEYYVNNKSYLYELLSDACYTFLNDKKCITYCESIVLVPKHVLLQTPKMIDLSVRIRENEKIVNELESIQYDEDASLLLANFIRYYSRKYNIHKLHIIQNTDLKFNDDRHYTKVLKKNTEIKQENIEPQSKPIMTLENTIDAKDHALEKTESESTSEKPEDGHTSEKPEDGHTSEKPEDGHTSEKQESESTSEKQESESTSEKTEDGHTSEKTESESTSEKPEDGHTSEKTEEKPMTLENTIVVESTYDNNKTEEVKKEEVKKEELAKVKDDTKKEESTKVKDDASTHTSKYNIEHEILKLGSIPHKYITKLIGSENLYSQINSILISTTSKTVKRSHLVELATRKIFEQNELTSKIINSPVPKL